MKILILLATLTILASCTAAPPPSPTPTPETKVMEGSKTLPEDTMMKDEMKDTMMMSGEMMDHSGSDMGQMSDAMKLAGYVNYDDGKVRDALAKGQKVILYFYAPWCPGCRTLDSHISNNLREIPSDTLIVKVDYDSALDLRKQYGVTDKHTIVKIDKDMNLVSKKMGGYTVGEVLN